MAFENLIVRSKRKIGGITIDGVISEDTTLTMKLTSHPIEDGSSVADHIITDPLTYSMQGIITDTPLGLDGIGETASGVADAATGIFGASDSTGQTRSKQVYEELVSLMKKKELLEVQTTLRLYTDLVMTSIGVNATKDTSRAVRFSATFSQALVVKTSFTSVDSNNISGDANKAGNGNELNKGNTPVNNLNSSETSSAFNSLGQ